MTARFAQENGQHYLRGSCKYVWPFPAGDFNSVCGTDAIPIALLLYDVLLCMDKEVQYVWQSPKTSRKLSRVLYTFNRYMPFLYNIMSVGFTVTMSDTVSATRRPYPHSAS